MICMIVYFSVVHKVALVKIFVFPATPPISARKLINMQQLLMFEGGGNSILL